MPHLAIQHTANIQTDFDQLCRKLVDTILSIRNEQGHQVFPEGGTRVMAFPATSFSVGDGKGDYAFMFFSLRIVEGRSRAVIKETGDKLLATIKAHVEPIFDRPMGITLHIEETPKQLPGAIVLAYEGFHNNLRTIFGR